MTSRCRYSDEYESYRVVTMNPHTKRALELGLGVGDLVRISEPPQNKTRFAWETRLTRIQPEVWGKHLTTFAYFFPYNTTPSSVTQEKGRHVGWNLTGYTVEKIEKPSIERGDDSGTPRRLRYE